MSLFRSMMRDFDDDPFFRGPMESVRQMESMMDAMMSPFGGLFGSMGVPQLDFRSNRVHDLERPGGNSLMPFGFGRSLFPNMDGMFSNFDRLAQNPNCHSYSSSSVMTFTTDEHGIPQVYQASSSRTMAPGGVSETRRSVQDSRTGLQKMAIGHHMDERAHIVEKSRNRYTGEEDECQEFVNIEDDDAEQFNRDWQDKINMYRPRQTAINGTSRWRERSPGISQQREQLAITAGPESTVEVPENIYIENTPSVKLQTSEPKPKRKHGSKSHRSGHKSHSKPHRETSM